jgi:hypothetical protein
LLCLSIALFYAIFRVWCQIGRNRDFAGNPTKMNKSPPLCNYYRYQMFLDRYVDFDPKRIGGHHLRLYRNHHFMVLRAQRCAEHFCMNTRRKSNVINVSDEPMGNS